MLNKFFNFFFFKLKYLIKNFNLNNTSLFLIILATIVIFFLLGLYNTQIFVTNYLIQISLLIFLILHLIIGVNNIIKDYVKQTNAMIICLEIFLTILMVVILV